MKENAYDLLIYVYEEFIGSEYWSNLCDDRDEAFLGAFYEAGCSDEDIERFIDWFNFTFSECDAVRNQPLEEKPKQTKDAYNRALNRTYSYKERQHLGHSGPLFLDTLFTAKFINLSQREFIIERAMAIESSKCIKLDQLKWLTLMIITNQEKGFVLNSELQQFITNWLPNTENSQRFLLH